MNKSQSPGRQAQQQNALSNRPCPECGREMVEFDRLTEDGALYVWYACTRDGCMGQWLAKRNLSGSGV